MTMAADRRELGTEAPVTDDVDSLLVGLLPHGAPEVVVPDGETLCRAGDRADAWWYIDEDPIMSARTRTSHREYLRKLPVFATLSPRQLDAIDERATTLDLQPGYVVAREGDVSREMVLLVEGRLAVTRAGRHIATLGPGDAIGEQGLLAERSRNATVTVVEPSRVLHLDVRAFRNVIESVPEVAARLLPIVAARAEPPTRVDEVD